MPLHFEVRVQVKKVTSGQHLLMIAVDGISFRLETCNIKSCRPGFGKPTVLSQSYGICLDRRTEKSEAERRLGGIIQKEVKGKLGSEICCILDYLLETAHSLLMKKLCPFCSVE